MTSFLIIFLFDVSFTVSGVFNLTFVDIPLLLPYMKFLSIGFAPQYIVYGVAALVVIGIGFYGSSHTALKLTSSSQFVIVVSGLTVMFADAVLTFDPHNGLLPTASGSTPFSSARLQSGFGEARAEGGQNNLLLIMVESLGSFRNPDAWSAVSVPIMDLADSGRFRVTEGVSPYLGHTTNGEIRELCGEWRDYLDLPEGELEYCLPHQLQREGYETIAIHAFESELFDREQWYPRVGFERRLFIDAPRLAGLEKCISIFHGPCDHSVFPLVIDELQADGLDRPKFIHFLTLTSHLPFVYSGKEDKFDCEGDMVGLFRQKISCHLASYWRFLFEEFALAFTEPGFPPTDILIVGDHAPPFLNKSFKAEFETNIVPWIYLEYRGSETGVAAGGSGR